MKLNNHSKSDLIIPDVGTVVAGRSLDVEKEVVDNLKKDKVFKAWFDEKKLSTDEAKEESSGDDSKKTGEKK